LGAASRRSIAERFDSYAGQKLEVTGEQPAPSGLTRIGKSWIAVLLHVKIPDLYHRSKYQRASYGKQHISNPDIMWRIPP
jgi:hypothetical protein